MRATEELERLAEAGRPLLSEAESLVDADEEDRILARILASPPEIRARPRVVRLRPALALAGAAVVAAAIAVVALSGSFDREARHHGLRLTGATVSLAGYHFRTPAGFKESSNSCSPSATERFSAAASADGGCVEAYFAISSSGSAIPDGAEPIDVGAYQGYLFPQDGSVTTLYVVLPAPGGDFDWQAILLISKGLTPDQLVAVAESGLP